MAVLRDTMLCSLTQRTHRRLIGRSRVFIVQTCRNHVNLSLEPSKIHLLTRVTSIKAFESSKGARRGVSLIIYSETPLRAPLLLSKALIEVTLVSKCILMVLGTD